MQRQLREKYNNSFGKYLTPIYESREDCFKDLLFCSICGNKLNRQYSVSCGKRYYRYTCRNLETFRNNKHVVISEKQLKNLLDKEIEKLIAENISLDCTKKTLKLKYEELRQKRTKSIESMERRRKNLEYERLKAYENYCQERITMVDYEKIKEDKEGQEKTIKREIQILESQQIKLKNQYLKGIEFTKNLYMIDKDNLEYYKNLIEKIIVYQDKRLDIHFTFRLRNSGGRQSV